MILQMVAANMGIAVLPKWLVNSLSKQSLVQTKRIGETGIYKTLYARYQAQSPHIEIIEQLIPQTIAAFERLNKAEITE
jgi:LysR family transcriptional regulator for metE and metH